MITIKTAFKSNRLMKALTGMTISEFNNLCISFERIFEANAKVANKKKKRKRKEGAGVKHTLNTIEKKLFFILFYIKCYTTFDLAGFYFGVDRSQVFRWFTALLPILEETLGYEVVLPERQINSVEDFQNKFPEIKDLFIDGVERPVQRPKDGKRQGKYYSGKKKRHMRKNIVATDENRKILVLSPTRHGKAHDKKLLDKSALVQNIPKYVTVWIDTAFVGINKENIMMPKKKPKGKELTDQEKQNNKTISGLRIIVENAINGPKRFRAVSDIFRNRIAGMDDKIIRVACGLWNYHLRMTN